MRSLVWALVLVLLAAPAAGAQETRGNINGVVRDAGGIIPGAMVRITNTGTSQTQQLVTNNQGYFDAVLLNPGTYDVRVELQGYKTYTQTGISLAVGQTLSLTVRLDVGQLSEEITTTENKVVFARQAYNDAATDYNTYRQTFPPVVFANMFGHNQDAELLDFDDAQIAEAPKVSFT